MLIFQFVDLAENHSVTAMVVETPKEFFEKQLHTQFRPEKAEGINAVAQVNLTGPDGGNWTITIKDQKMHVTEGNAPAPTLKLTVAASDFMDMINHKLKVEKAFFSGKISFEGELTVALKLRDTGFF